jgi:hypothetical protein
MISMQKSQLQDLIRESYLHSVIKEGKDHNREIVSTILSLKDSLLKRNFICNTQYVAPIPQKKHRDFGYCTVKIDTTIGRGKQMSQRAINQQILKMAQQIGLNKYFSIVDHGYDGRYCNCNFRLNPKFVDKYMQEI